MIDFKEIAISILEKQGVNASSVSMAIPGDFVHINLYTTPKSPGDRSIGLNIRLDSDLEENGTWPTRTQVRWIEIVDATSHEAREMAHLMAVAAELAAAFDTAIGTMP